jgi:hypothetical protein
MASKEEVTQVLDTVDDINQGIAALRGEKQDALDSVMPSEIKDQIAELNKRIEALTAPFREQFSEIELQYHGKLAELEYQASTLLAQAKTDVKEIGESVKGKGLHAVYTKPKAIWDAGKLEGLALEHPYLLGARSYSEPSVSIRAVGK